MKRIATHEAAHFVTFLLYFRDWAKFDASQYMVTIVPDTEQGSLGHFKHEELPMDIDTAKKIKYFLSGWAGEFVASKKKNSLLFLGRELIAHCEDPTSDGGKAFDNLFALLAKDDPEVNDIALDIHLHPYFQQVTNDLKNNWQLVEMVSGELFTLKTIEGENMKSLWDKILDGMKAV